MTSSKALELLMIFLGSKSSALHALKGCPERDSSEIEPVAPVSPVAPVKPAQIPRLRSAVRQAGISCAL